MNRHDFDRAMAAGIDSGRYLLVVDPGATESRPAKGPNFGDPSSRTTDPVLIEHQVRLDIYLNLEQP